MPQRVIIPITDESDAAACTGSYQVRYHKSGSDFWQSLTPNPVATPVVIENLDDETDYEAEIIRVCCTGQRSLPLTVPFTTPAP